MPKMLFLETVRHAILSIAVAGMEALEKTPGADETASQGNGSALGHAVAPKGTTDISPEDLTNTVEGVELDSSSATSTLKNVETMRQVLRN
ncbi:hypothetical protein HDU67_002081 [Dinochytrium kinnereticum]|nr:hypothetical protein HDU67_002081 [Dinochytrium kinnereticum]